MDIIRRNTDYALRMMVHLAGCPHDRPASARQMSETHEISNVLASKLLQRLQKARLVQSIMGSKGGFRLAKPPSQISLFDVITAIQGPVTLNRCLLNLDACKRRPHCPITTRLNQLQNSMETFLKEITLNQLVDNMKK